MSFSDETLMAFADGELDDITKHEVELAMRLDPQLAARVRQHQRLRSNVFNAFAPTQDQAVPQRAQGAARSGKVVHLNTARAARNVPLPAPPPPSRQRRGEWSRWSALAGTLVFGMLAGALAMQRLGAADTLVAVEADGGSVTARGNLADMLSQQAGQGAPADAAVRIGTSFLSREGVYCRSFTLPNTGGLACREGGAWRIAVLAAIDGGGSEYRQAGSVMPGAVLDAVAARISGKALDATAERMARQQGWQR